MNTYRGKCRQCGAVKADSKMIYNVSENRYYCDQLCYDAFYGIKRDKKGFIVKETEL